MKKNALIIFLLIATALTAVAQSADRFDKTPKDKDNSSLTDDNYQSEETPKSGWANYEIAQRTAENPLVNKSFLKGKLTKEQLNNALTTPYVDTAVKVYDAANLLSKEEISSLQSRIRQFINKHNTDMVIVTLNNNPRKADSYENATNKFAMDFYEYNDFGKGEPTKDGYDGVILTIDMQNRYFSILDVGTPNIKFGVARLENLKYVEAMTPDIKAQRYGKAIKSFVDSYQEDLEAFKMVEYFIPDHNAYKEDSVSKKVKDITSMIGQSIFIGIIIALIILHFTPKNYKNIRKATAAGTYVKKGSFNLTVKEDTFVSTNTTKEYSPIKEEREEREHYSYSSYDSDSDSHSSSSGRSFGGGGGSF